MDTNLLLVKCFLCQSSFNGWRNKSGFATHHLNDFYNFIKEINSSGSGNLNDSEILSICTCEDCAHLIKSAMEEKLQLDQVEIGVRKLQLELLKQLKMLQNHLNTLSQTMKLVAGRVNKFNPMGARDCELTLVPEQTVQILTAGGQEAENYRDGIANAVKNMTLFQDNLAVRVNANILEEGVKHKKEEAFASTTSVYFPDYLDSDVKEESDWDEGESTEDIFKPHEDFSSEELQSSSTTSNGGHQERIPCNQCGKMLQKDYLRHHMRKVHGGKYKCPTCEKKFSTREVLQRHLDRGHGRKGRYKCNVCSRTFDSNAAVSAHLINVHGEEPQKLTPALASYRCKVCRKQCITKGQFIAHQDTHLSSEDRERKLCPHCGKLILVTFFRKHVSDQCAEINKSQSQEVICAQCGKSFANSRQLSGHRSKVHRHENLSCHLCGKGGIKTNYLLKCHVARHSGKRDFICDRCGGGYKTRVDLTRHKYTCDGSKEPRKLENSKIIIDSSNTESKQN